MLRMRYRIIMARQMRSYMAEYNAILQSSSNTYAREQDSDAASSFMYQLF